MLNLSSLKLLSGVFFALFILSACGGGGGGAAAPAAGGGGGVTCDANEFNDNGTCVAAIDTSTCDSMQATDNNLCLPVLDPNDTSVNNCGVTFYYNSSTNTCDTKLVATDCAADQTVNTSLNACVTNISGGVSCDSATEFTRTVGGVSICEPKLVAADCDSGAVTADNKCSAVTASICASMQVNPADNTACLPVNAESCTTTNGYYYNAANAACDISVEASSCGTDETLNSMNYCGATTNLTAAHFQGNSNSEYYQSDVLDGVKAAEAYANISTLAATMPTVRQAGAGQTVSVAYQFGFATDHAAFVNGDGTTAFTDNGVYDASTDADVTATQTTATCSESCRGTADASLIAGRKGGTETSDMHGIAYNANLKGIITNNTQLVNAIPAGVGADIVAMAHAWNNDTTKSASSTDQLADAELHAWVKAVDPAGTNKTIMVFSAGSDGRNTENGTAPTSNIPDWRAAYPAIHTDDAYDFDHDSDTNTPNATFSGDFTSDRWLVVTGVDSSDKILSNFNGCGVAMEFCLAVSAGNINAAQDTVSNPYSSNSQSRYTASTVAGAMAVLKGAFPNATPEELTALVLDTADYIALDDESANAGLIQMVALKDGSASPAMRKINEVYGYGKLNLATATSASATSYVTASNNESIGALWTDTKLTLSSHFGGNFESVKFGIGDAYGRHFITAAPQTTSAPIAVSLDDYMANMLADNVQTQKLGGQAQANYSNNGEQSWMNLEYISGKATTKIAFQDSYKISPLSDTGTTTILRANNIRPASTNIGMMDVDYKLGNALSLSSYAARGEYDTGYKFDELATDFDVNYKDSHLNIAIGNIREHGQFLGTNTSGAYALNAPSISRFTDVTYGHNIGNKFNLYANYINYETDVDMLHDQFATIDNLQADQYQIGFTGKDLISKDDSLNVALITKLGVTDGALNQNSTLGYTANGAFNNASQSYDLAVSDRHQQFEITYQGRLYQNADKISKLRDNRFFTSIRVDSNLNHVQGASQVEVVSGINIRY